MSDRKRQPSHAPTSCEAGRPPARRRRRVASRAAILLLLLAPLSAGSAHARDDAAREVLGYRLQVEEKPRASVVGVAPGQQVESRPLVTFAPAVVGASDRLEELIEHNASGDRAARVGFVRGRADAAFAFDGQSESRDAGTYRLERVNAGVVYSARVRVEEAWALRIRLDSVVLPDDAQIWVIGEADGPRDEPLVLGPFGEELLDDTGGLWLPAAPGPEVTVEVHLPRFVARSASRTSFTITEIAELFDLEDPWLGEEIRRAAEPANPRDEIVAAAKGLGGDWEACRVDATCIGTSELEAVENLREAVARITFMEDGITYACTATLLADQDYTGTPYLLTANHCFSTPAVAASLTAYFDYRTDVCDGTEPNLFGLPQVSGSTLLVTAPENDLTLVELSGLPSGDAHFMGWTPDRPVHGEVMHSVTHPGGRSQTWATSTYIAEGEPSLCTGAYDRSHYHLSTRLEGATSFGSSGGAQILDREGGLVIGQILGACFQSSFEFCNGTTYDNVTGSFEHNYALVQPWLGDEPGRPDPVLIFADGFESGDISAWLGAPGARRDILRFPMTQRSQRSAR